MDYFMISKRSFRMHFKCFFFLFFFSAVFLVSGQSKSNTDLLLLNKLGSSLSKDKIEYSNDVSRLLNKYTTKKDTSEIDTVDSLSTTDSTDSIKTNDLSVYQKLITGENINPDSMLKNINIFGYDLFSKLQPFTFAPTNEASVPADYPISAGDEINLLLWGRINEEYNLTVSRDGTINIPRIGPVSVANQTFNNMKKNITDRIEKIGGVNSSISMGKLRTIGVYIVGEVKTPGFYTISALSNVTNALFYAGGPTHNGSLRNVQLKRNGKIVATIDFYDFLLSGNDHSNLKLQSGDVIIVPLIKEMAAVVGNVRRSALYELKEKTNLKDIIEIAGGITPAAWVNRIQIERFLKNEKKIVLDIDSINQKFSQFEIMDGDIVKIYPILEKDKNAVYLSGNVLRPGKYEFHDGMKITDIIPDYHCLLPETYFEYAIILRQEPPSFLNRIIAFDLKQILENPDSQQNILLQERDQIVIYDRDFFEPDRSVSIEGAVTKTGKYKLLNNMKIRDLILQAGGLSDEASPTRGELYRRVSRNNEIISIEKLDFSIESAMKDDPQHNLLLQKSDWVFIRSKKGWENERKVTLSGQFVYPGTYVLFEKETLGDLIKRAGGFKDDASLSAAIFTRKSIGELQKKYANEYSKQTEMDILKLSTDATTKLDPELIKLITNQQLSLTKKSDEEIVSGRVIIDLNDESNYSDFYLEDGDELHVPRTSNTVSVVGEVFNPSTFKYEKNNRKVSDVIETAGGMKKNADKKRVYIIKANGKIVTNKSIKILSSNLEPGDAVVVPQKIKYSKGFAESIKVVFETLGALTTVVTLIVALKSL